MIDRPPFPCYDAVTSDSPHNSPYSESFGAPHRTAWMPLFLALGSTARVEVQALRSLVCLNKLGARAPLAERQAL